MCLKKWRCISTSMGCTSADAEDRSIDTEELITQLRQTLDDRSAIDPVILDVRGVSSITDYFVIATGTSPPHLRALSEEIEIPLKRAGEVLYKRSGIPDSGWIILDFVDVVVHLFTEEVRAYYALEKLWSDGKVLCDF